MLLNNLSSTFNVNYNLNTSFINYKQNILGYFSNSNLKSKDYRHLNYLNKSITDYPLSVVNYVNYKLIMICTNISITLVISISTYLSIYFGISTVISISICFVLNKIISILNNKYQIRQSSNQNRASSLTEKAIDNLDYLSFYNYELRIWKFYNKLVYQSRKFTYALAMCISFLKSCIILLIFCWLLFTYYLNNLFLKESIDNTVTYTITAYLFSIGGIYTIKMLLGNADYVNIKSKILRLLVLLQSKKINNYNTNVRSNTRTKSSYKINNKKLSGDNNDNSNIKNFNNLSNNNYNNYNNTTEEILFPKHYYNIFNEDRNNCTNNSCKKNFNNSLNTLNKKIPSISYLEIKNLNLYLLKLRHYIDLPTYYFINQKITSIHIDATENNIIGISGSKEASYIIKLLDKSEELIDPYSDIVINKIFSLNSIPDKLYKINVSLFNNSCLFFDGLTIKQNIILNNKNNNNLNDVDIHSLYINTLNMLEMNNLLEISMPMYSHLINIKDLNRICIARNIMRDASLILVDDIDQPMDDYQIDLILKYFNSDIFKSKSKIAIIASNNTKLLSLCSKQYHVDDFIIKSNEELFINGYTS